MPATGKQYSGDTILNNCFDGTDTLGMKLSGRIPEYAWLDGAAEPTPTEAFAWGYKFNATTGVLTSYGWTGTAGVEVV